jgi:hypothetical protein
MPLRSIIVILAVATAWLAPESGAGSETPAKAAVGAWTQWGGPGRDFWLRNLPEGPLQLEEQWRRPVGGGHEPGRS